MSEHSTFIFCFSLEDGGVNSFPFPLRLSIRSLAKPSLRKQGGYDLCSAFVQTPALTSKGRFASHIHLVSWRHVKTHSYDVCKRFYNEDFVHFMISYRTNTM